MSRDFFLNMGVDIAFILYPFLLGGLFAAPFVVTYFRKRKITLRSAFFCAVIGGSLVLVALWATYWGLGYLQGQAAQDLYDPI